MIEQEKVNRSRIIGYAVGIVVFVVAIAWKMVSR
jgi:hypothetical protein